VNVFPPPFPLQAVIINGSTTVIHGAGGVGSLAISAGTLSGIRSDLTFSNSNGVSFGLDTNGVITASVGAFGAGLTNIKLSAGVASELRSDVTFSNSNGVSFGLNAGTITASVQTDYQSPGAYLTTAQPPGAYLTTAQPPGAYLTTAMASGQSSNFVQANATFFGTNASGTIASNGISVSVAAVGAGGAGTGFTTATTAGTDVVGTLSTNGLSMGIPAFLTTAAAGGGITNVAMSAGTVSTLASAFTFSNSNNVTFGFGTGASAGVITASFSAAGGAGAGTNTSVITTAGTDLSFEVNTSGITIAYPAWLTTAANSTVTGGGGGGATLSFYNNLELVSFNAKLPIDRSGLFVFPFILPQAVNFGYIRLWASLGPQGTSGVTATSANTSFTANQSLSSAMLLFTQMPGANSNSLGLLTSKVMSFGWQNSISNGNTGSQFSVSINLTYPIQGTYSTTQFTSAYTATAYSVGVAQLSNFSFNKCMDVPYQGSLTAGNYWLAVGFSSASAVNGPSALTNAKMNDLNFYGNTQAVAPGLMGVTAATSVQMFAGLGQWHTTLALSSTSVIAFSDISAITNSPIIYFQMNNGI
jgi:hypothetical protein